LSAYAVGDQSIHDVHECSAAVGSQQEFAELLRGNGAKARGAARWGMFRRAVHDPGNAAVHREGLQRLVPRCPV